MRDERERIEKRGAFGSIKGIFDIELGLSFHCLFTLFSCFYCMFDLYEKPNFYYLIMIISLYLNTIPLKKHINIKNDTEYL